MIGHFLTSSNNIEKSSYIWNLAGSTLNAFQSVIFLIFITRETTLNDAGVFSIAYANSILLLNIGKYGMRNFQISDCNSQFSFKEYKTSRFITASAMLFCSVIYTIVAANLNNYPLKKSIIILVMCIYKLIDAVEDIFHGFYQQNNRLDIAGKMMSLRMFLTIVCFGVSIIITKSLLLSLIITTTVSGLLCTLFIISVNGTFNNPDSFETKNLKKLLKICFPLFLSMFLSFFINNAPKYAIDITSSDELQACYGFIFMPVFVIELLNGFIFNPILYKLSLQWKNSKYKNFAKLLIRQTIYVMLITLICEAAAYIAGIPVLSFIYSEDLSPYKKDLLVLLLGGGCLALAGLLVTALTIMRKQKSILVIYTITSIFALLFSKKIISLYSLNGASFLYLSLMFLLVLLSSVYTIIYICKASKN